MNEPSLPIGLALVRPTQIMGAEPYFHELIAGIERATLPLGHSVLMRVLADHEQEARTYQEWAAEQLVACVLIVDILENDPRPNLMNELGLPAVIVGPPVDPRFTTIWTDDGDAMRTAVTHLAGEGYRRIVHVGGPINIVHSEVRRKAFLEVCAELELESVGAAGDYSRESGASAIEALLPQSDVPTAAIFDSDLMALGGLDAVQVSGLSVPQDLALLAWDDSAQCQLSNPPLSAVSRDVRAIGQQIGDAVLKLLEGAPPVVLHAAEAVVIDRSSSHLPVIQS